MVCWLLLIWSTGRPSTRRAPHEVTRPPNHVAHWPTEYDAPRPTVNRAFRLPLCGTRSRTSIGSSPRLTSLADQWFKSVASYWVGGTRNW
ncbi:hypothetical protein K461DRAFT_278577 [Myriangium duriaei CBS 260.36]|uniref:Secreted protein n=1 Tax=Myriangium duriaei CBS 260.36 TaxID=1168546 RepID=A0A9P4IYR4_9PEZI|nr:hypothetical protein K461DRAFT_278577 [Myriangium duriaei CBS 260.36]